MRRWSEAETRTRVRLDKLLADFPDLDEEVLAGRLGVAQAHTLAKAAANPRCGNQIGESLSIFLEHAGNMSHVDFQRLVGHWELIADADDAHRDADASHRQRRASWGTDDDSGDFTLHLHCGAAQGAQTAISRSDRLPPLAVGVAVRPRMQAIPVADAVAAVLIGRIRVVITDQRGVVLHMGRTRRLFTGKLREAVMLAGAPVHLQRLQPVHQQLPS